MSFDNPTNDLKENENIHDLHENSSSKIPTPSVFDKNQKETIKINENVCKSNTNENDTSSLGKSFNLSDIEEGLEKSKESKEISKEKKSQNEPFESETIIEKTSLITKNINPIADDELKLNKKKKVKSNKKSKNLKTKSIDENRKDNLETEDKIKNDCVLNEDKTIEKDELSENRDKKSEVKVEELAEKTDDNEETRSNLALQSDEGFEESFDLEKIESNLPDPSSIKFPEPGVKSLKNSPCPLPPISMSDSHKSLKKDERIKSKRSKKGKSLKNELNKISEKNKIPYTRKNMKVLSAISARNFKAANRNSQSKSIGNDNYSLLKTKSCDVEEKFNMETRKKSTSRVT